MSYLSESGTNTLQMSIFSRYSNGKEHFPHHVYGFKTQVKPLLLTDKDDVLNTIMAMMA